MMSQTQYKTLMSNLLNEKHALVKLRAELEGRKEKLCRCCKGFGHLAQNCRKQKETKEGVTMPQNKFEVLRSRIMQCGIEERVVRSMRMVVVRCFKYREEGHKCRECLLWIKRKNEGKEAACVAMPHKAQQERRPARPVRGKAQEERKLRRVEEDGAAHLRKGEAQQEWKRSSTEELRKRAEEHCRKGVPREARLLELGWMTEDIVVSYLTCKCGEKGSHVEDNRGQGVVLFWKWKELS